MTDCFFSTIPEQLGRVVMADSEVGPLVSCEWLQGKITSGDMGNIVILDVSWSSSKDCQQEFLRRHIPGAQYLDVMVGPHSELFPRSLPPPEVFQEAARTAGVQEDSHVILYSDSDNCGFFLSCRAWWTFMVYGARSVSILNGGLQRWQSLDYPTTSDYSQVKRGDFTAREAAQYRRSLQDMTSVLASSHPNLFDSRAHTSFDEGHIKGAASLPASRLVDKEKQQMLDPQQLHQELEQVGMDLSTPLTSYCNSGMSSCTVAFAYKLCGGANVAVYHGGFTEWKKKKSEEDIERSKKA